VIPGALRRAEASLFHGTVGIITSRIVAAHISSACIAELSRRLPKNIPYC